jgi:phospholipid/cholesterol/gamma-HCH transport system substrate-binding protein
MQASKSDVWVGLFVLLGIAALVFLALQAGNLLSFTTTAGYTVTAKFDNIGGLKPRAPVKSAGVVVGRIEAIRFNDKTFQADVIMNLDTRFAFPKDSSAKILTAGLLGEQYVGLEPGGDVNNLKQGDIIRQTQSAVVLENVISQFLYNKAADTGSAPGNNAGSAKNANNASNDKDPSK